MNVPWKRVHLRDRDPDNDPDCYLDCDPDNSAPCKQSQNRSYEKSPST